MLVDQNNANILPLLCVLLERPLYLPFVGLVLYYEEIPLGIDAGRDMLSLSS